MPDPFNTSAPPAAAPAPASAPGPQTRPAPPSTWAGTLLPFVPIALALLAALLAPHFMPAPLTDEALVGTSAPDFSLPDAHQDDGAAPVTLSRLAAKGPVLLVFYRSYACPRCMTHLAMIASQIEDYQKAGIQILAISPDSPADTRASIAQYQQDFPFPLLSDRDDQIARAYGLETADGDFLHGVFVIGTDRRIRFARRTEEPYGDALSLLDQVRNVRNSP